MSKSKREPLIDEEGEVRELLREDIRKLRPATQTLPPSLLEKPGIKTQPSPRKRGEDAKENVVE